jgi:putative two-component system response regulator
MKTHAQVGADAIWHALQDEDDMEAVDFLYVAMDIAGNHHEKWDGSGYPKGKSGDKIPLSARLMAVADVFDALISRRIYKPPFSIETALEMIIENSGTHFDPDIVDALKRRIEDFREIAARYEDPGPQDEPS